MLRRRRRRTAAVSVHRAIEFMEMALYDYFDDRGPDDNFDIISFEDAGLLTGDKGFILTVGEDQFQVSVVKSSSKY